MQLTKKIVLSVLQRTHTELNYEWFQTFPLFSPDFPFQLQIFSRVLPRSSRLFPRLTYLHETIYGYLWLEWCQCVLGKPRACAITNILCWMYSMFLLFLSLSLFCFLSLFLVRVWKCIKHFKDHVKTFFSSLTFSHLFCFSFTHP